MVGCISHEGLAMRKVTLSAASLTFVGFMLHGAVACELNREASQPASTIVLPVGCSGLNCLANPPQDLLTALGNEEPTPVDPVQDYGAIYFDVGTYSGSNGLPDWIMASLGAQNQDEPGGGFARSPMDAYAQDR
jgi:hypothetical protein